MEKIILVKIGGNILDNPEPLQRFLTDFNALPGWKILVHGGGKIASEISRQLGITPAMVEGRRVTDADTLRVVTMVYGGLINKKIVAQLQALGCNAIGLTGADANLIAATKRAVTTIDYGFAGDIAGAESINVTALIVLLSAGLIPVLAPLTHDGAGNLLNTNADTIASVLAAALAPTFNVKLIYCFEKKGVLLDVNNERSVIRSITERDYTQLKQDGVLADGMIPKLDNAMQALRQGVKQVYICQADDLKEIVKGAEAVGTKLYLSAQN